ncbi:DUF3939 domain-containing protein [Paenibacillus pinistramenti]|uniref:DUF3939 domain-containing protein n=1 Tax=Paenibacillus pinistramenti TaxID=1768003 RepID=UPI001109E8A0|nr:DUF3939 domain-containing protein [Paenibacillus pinistramenti]
MFFRKKKLTAAEPVHVSIEEIRRAVLQFEDDMPGSVNRLALIQNDGSLDTNRLTRYLGGPSRSKFYLSRETFEIFEEAEKHIPYYLDLVQLAVDDYVNETGKLPLLEGTREGEVDYRVLMKEHYLKEFPPLPLYLTDQELMLSRHPIKLH